MISILIVLLVSFTLNADTGNFFADSAGMSSSATLSTSVGKMSMMATSGRSITSLGYGSGAKCVNVDHIVSIGDNTFSGCSNCSKVVAIGSGAATGISSATNLTTINGHFYASQQQNAFWITPNATNSYIYAPISYVGGTLRLNASRILTPSGTLSGGDTIDYGCDMYVDGTRGSDVNDGRSTSTAKRSMDAAISAASNGWTIGVMPGRYGFPTYYNGLATPSKSIRIKAVKGSDETYISGTNGVTDRLVGSSAHHPCVIGFTITGLARAENLGNNSDACEYVVFDGCDISTTNRLGWSKALFGGCVFTNTHVTAHIERVPLGSGHTGVDGYYFSLVCDYVGTVVEITSSGEGYGPAVCIYDRLENSYFHVDKPRGFGFDPRQLTVSGLPSGCRGTTLVSDEVPQRFRTTLGNVDGMYHGSLIGMEGFAYSSRATESIITNASAVMAVLGADRRATSSKPIWRLYGYGSAEDRLLADAIRAYVNGGN